MALIPPARKVVKQRVGTRRRGAPLENKGAAKRGIASLPHVKLAPECSATHVWNVKNIRTQSSPSLLLGRGGVCFEVLTFSQLSGRQQTCPESADSSSQLMFLTKEKDPTTKFFDDDERIRSLTEAHEITADVPEDSVMYDQQAVDPKRSGPFKWVNSCGNTSRGGSLRSVKVKLQPSRHRCESSELDSKVALKPLPSSTSSSTTRGPQDH